MLNQDLDPDLLLIRDLPAWELAELFSIDDLNEIALWNGLNPPGRRTGARVPSVIEAIEEIKRRIPAGR